VNVLNRILVIGHTPTQINLLTELDPEDVAHMKQQPANVDFANQLRALVKRKIG